MESSRRPIVLAVDGSSALPAASRTAIELAERTDRPLWIVASWWVEPRTFGAIPPTDVTELGVERRERARSRLDRAAAEARAAGIEVHTSLVEGPCGAAVASVAKDVDAWVVVTADAKRTRLERLLDESVPRRVARRVRCRVLAVGQGGEQVLVPV